MMSFTLTLHSAYGGETSPDEYHLLRTGAVIHTKVPHKNTLQLCLNYFLLMIYCDSFDPHPAVYRTFMTTHSTTYKWWLFMYQITSSTFDFVFTVLIIPVVFFPIPMGYADSTVARWLAISGHASLIMFILCLPPLTVTILNLFIYRCDLVIPQHHFLKINHRGQVITCVILLVVYYVPTGAGLAVILPNHLEARRWVLEEYSCAQSMIDIPRIQIYTSDSIFPLVIVATSLGTLATIIVVYTIWASFHFLGNSAHMSQRTRLMQKRYIKCLCVQVSVALCTLLVPVLALMYMFGTQAAYSQATGNFALCCMSFHGSSSPISLIMCNDTYRKFTFKLFKYCRTQQQKLNVSVTVEANVIRSVFQQSTSRCR